MKKFRMLLPAFLLAATTVAAEEKIAEPPPEPPAWETRADADDPVRAEMRQRRYEIMVLLQAYRILPDELKPAVKAELLERLRDDYAANRRRLKQMVERMEQELARLKQKLAEPEDAETAAETEFERLLVQPIGGMGPDGWLPPGGPGVRRGDGERQQHTEGVRETRGPRERSGQAPEPRD